MSAWRPEKKNKQQGTTEGEVEGDGVGVAELVGEPESEGMSVTLGVPEPVLLGVGEHDALLVSPGVWNNRMSSRIGPPCPLPAVVVD